MKDFSVYQYRSIYHALFSKKSSQMFSIVFLFISSLPLIAQTDPYRGDLRQNDLRSITLKQHIKAGKVISEPLRLRYSRAYLNFAIFYDLTGHEIWYRYRDYRFDYRAERRLRVLIPGQAYAVSGNLEGLYFQDKLVKKQAANFQEHLIQVDAILIFQLGVIRALRLEQLLL